MPDIPSSRPHKTTGRDVGTGKVITLTKTQPAQLSLFGEFLPPEARDSYSNTIELYDAIPKYFSSKKTMAELRRDGIFLKSLKRRFRHRDQYYELVIKPARLIDKDGQEKEYYPSHQEEIVEEALKKLACDRLNGVFLNDTAGVQFTLYELDSELKRQGHAMKWSDLIASLEICRGAGIEVIGPEGKVEVKSSIFPVVALVNRAEWEQNPKQVRCYVQFNPLVTYSINKLAFRQFDYATYMQLKNHLARWLFKHLSHHYIQASWDTPYTIMHSTIVGNSYLVNNAQRRDQVRYVCQAFDELKGKADVIAHYKKQMITGPRKKIEDVKYEILPSLAFINQIKKANRRHQEITQKALELGVLTQEHLVEQYLKEAKKGEENPSGRAQGTLLKYPAITRGWRHGSPQNIRLSHAATLPNIRLSHAGQGLGPQKYLTITRAISDYHTRVGGKISDYHTRNIRLSHAGGALGPSNIRLSHAGGNLNQLQNHGVKKVSASLSF